MKITRDVVRIGLQNFLERLIEEKGKENSVIEDVFGFGKYRIKKHSEKYSRR